MDKVWCQYFSSFLIFWVKISQSFLIELQISHFLCCMCLIVFFFSFCDGLFVFLFNVHVLTVSFVVCLFCSWCLDLLQLFPLKIEKTVPFFLNFIATLLMCFLFFWKTTLKQWNVFWLHIDKSLSFVSVFPLVAFFELLLLFVFVTIFSFFLKCLLFLFFFLLLLRLLCLLHDQVLLNVQVYVNLIHAVAVNQMQQIFVLIVIQMVVINVLVVIQYLKEIFNIFVKIVLIYLVQHVYFVKIIMDVVNVQVDIN